MQLLCDIAISAYFKVLTTKHGLMARAGAGAYNGGLGAEPPVGSRGRAPGQGIRGAKPPSEAESLLAFQRPMTAAKFIPLTVCGKLSVSDVSTTITALNRIPSTSLLKTG